MPLWGVRQRTTGAALAGLEEAVASITEKFALSRPGAGQQKVVGRSKFKIITYGCSSRT
jgi:hypothetical protein